MKLYFYHLSQPLGEKPRIENEECEVEEGKRAFDFKGKFSKFYNGCYVVKNDIGKLIGRNRETLILTEKNAEKAAKIFKEKLHDDIEQYQNKIESLKKEVAKAYGLIDMVDDWRLENETH